MLYKTKHASWVDVPLGQEKEFEFLSKNTKTSLCDYHFIPKNDIDQRLASLHDIHSRVFYEVGDTNKQGKHLVNNISKRIAYFEKLNFLIDNQIIFQDNNPEIYDKAKVKEFFFNELSDATYEKRYLNNECRFDFKTNNNWGELWLELIDPAHRELDFYKKRWIEEKSKLPFFIYLENTPISHREPHIDFILDKDIERNKAAVVDGLIYLDGKPFSSPKTVDRYNEALFIISNQEDILIGLSSPTQRHVSLSRGDTVLGGGLLIVDNGKIKEIKGNSGHYLFYTKHMLQTIAILEEKGVILEKNIAVANFTDFYNNEEMPLEHFVQKYDQNNLATKTLLKQYNSKGLKI